MSSDSMKYSKGEGDVRRLCRNVPFILGSLLLLLIVGLAGVFDTAAIDDPSGANISYGLTQQHFLRPTIYQFDVLTGDIPPSPSPTRKIPYIWTQVWDSAGWIPQKLTVSKYAGRPEYRDILEPLQGRIDDNQLRHILKYLALHALGGGWVAHSDAFPLHDFRVAEELPNGGGLTVFDAHHPCLMSGSADEWLRMGRRLAEHARVFAPPEDWTEAVAMRQMRAEYTVQPEIFEVPNAGFDGKIEWVWNSLDCKATHDKRAVHFRIDAKEDFEGMEDPGDMVVKWLSMWLQSCERSDYFIDKEGEEKSKAHETAKNYPSGYGSVHVENDNDDKLLDTMNKMQTQSAMTNELAMNEAANNNVVDVSPSNQPNKNVTVPEVVISLKQEGAMEVSTPVSPEVPVTQQGVIPVQAADGEPDAPTEGEVVALTSNTEPQSENTKVAAAAAVAATATANVVQDSSQGIDHVTAVSNEHTPASTEGEGGEEDATNAPPGTLPMGGERRRARLKGWILASTAP